MTLRHIEVLFTGIIIEIIGHRWPISHPMLLYLIEQCSPKYFMSKHGGNDNISIEHWRIGTLTRLLMFQGNWLWVLANPTFQLPEAIDISSWLDIRLKSGN